MVKYCIFLIWLVLGVNALKAQHYIDSLRKELGVAKEDSNKAMILCLIAGYHEYAQPDSNDYYVKKAIELSEKINYPRGVLLANISKFFKTNLEADYPKALEIALHNLELAEALPHDALIDMAHVHLNIGLVKREMGDSAMALKETGEAERLQKASGKQNGDLWGLAFATAQAFQKKKQKDSALFYGQIAYEMGKAARTRRPYNSLVVANLALLYKDFGMYEDARAYFQEAQLLATYYDNVYIEARIYMNLVQFFIKTRQYDSAILFGNRALQICSQYHFGDYASTVADSLAMIFEMRGRPDSALHYMKVMEAAKDSIFSKGKMQKFLQIIADNDRKQREEDAARERYQSRVKLYSSLAGVLGFLVLSGVLYRSNRQKQKAFTVIREQKQETDIQKAKVEQAYQELKSTQNQLIQSEKMASLGELTAGIAHEIQNPLNFVKNFSEVNVELIEELKTELSAGNLAGVAATANGIRQNLEKVIHHGYRADGIVKGMLEHSRTQSGKKEPTDLNALADEYLRLSYHSFRAKDKLFDAQLEKSFDSELAEVHIVPKDIGRVFQNLLNNAFFSVTEKKKNQSLNQTAILSYEPKVSITTKRLNTIPGVENGAAEIRIRDNGMGIPKKVIDKIFQPFFTTKPTGEGTGLGLSLSYDIVTKEHHGELRVESTEGECCEFIIVLPKI